MVISILSSLMTCHEWPGMSIQYNLRRIEYSSSQNTIGPNFLIIDFALPTESDLKFKLFVNDLFQHQKEIHYYYDSIHTSIATNVNPGRVSFMNPRWAYGSSSLFIRVAIHNIELLYNAGAVVIRVTIHNVRKTD